MEEQTHYEVLEVPSDASPQQIARAYRIARATYQPGSAATYSLLSEEETAEALRRVEGAYAVLSDERLRREYDSRLRMAGMLDRSAAVPSVSSPEPQAPRPVRRVPEQRVELEEPVLPEDGIYDGEVLRRIRIGRGIELEEVAHITKIGLGYLSDIEANRYDVLPPMVYVRGFLREIARCLKLDPRTVADSYTQKAQASSKTKAS